MLIGPKHRHRPHHNSGVEDCRECAHDSGLRHGGPGRGRGGHRAGEVPRRIPASRTRGEPFVEREQLLHSEDAKHGIGLCRPRDRERSNHYSERRHETVALGLSFLMLACGLSCSRPESPQARSASSPRPAASPSSRNGRKRLRA